MNRSSYIIQLVLLLGFMNVSYTAKAQWHKWHFGGGVGSLTYYGDLSDKFVNANLQELGYHAYVERLIAKRSGIYWRLESVNGHLIGSDRAPGGWINGVSGNFDRSLNFRTRIHDVNTSLVFYFGSNRKRERPPFLNAYVRFGIGVGYFDVYGDLKDADGNFYNYWSDRTVRDLPENAPNAADANAITRDKDYETNLRELSIEKSYNRFKWQIPVGLGLKMRLGDAVSLLLDAQYTYAMTDYLDNVGDGRTRTDITDPGILRAADPAGAIGDRARNLDKPTGINDGYLYVSAGLSFNVRKNEKPKFKTPVYYPKTIIPVVHDSLKAESDTTIIHPLDSIANSIGETFGRDSIKREKKGEEPVPLEKADGDSIFLSIFQQNHKIWLAQDTLTAKRKADSVVLAKIPETQDKYIAQYYELHIPDSIQKRDTSILFKTDTITFDKSRMAIIRDSVSYMSAKTPLSIAPISAISSRTSVDSSKTEENVDSVAILIHELRLQLDNLERQISKDTLHRKSLPASVKSLDTSVIRPDTSAVNKKTDTLSGKRTVAADTLKLSPSTYQKVVVDTSGKDTLRKVTPAISSLLTSKTAADTLGLRADTALRNTVILRKDTILQDAGKPDSAGNRTIEELKKRITELENAKDTAVVKKQVPAKSAEENSILKDTLQKVGQINKDTVNNKRLEELKKKIVESEKTVSGKQDSILVSAKKEQPSAEKDTVSAKLQTSLAAGSKPEMTSSEQKDSIVSQPVLPDSVSTRTIEDLKKRIAELENRKDTIEKRQTTSKSISPAKDTVSQKVQAMADTANNNKLEELKRKIVSVDSLDSKAQTRQKKDSVRVEKEALRESPPASVDSSYNKKIDELKKRIDELENAPKQAKDTIKPERRISSDEISKSTDNGKDTLQNSASAARMIPATSEVSSNQDEELKNRIAELEKQIAQQKSAADSLSNIATRTNNSSVSAKSEPSASEKQQEELQKRMTELENQLKATQNARSNSAISPQEQMQYQARIDSLNQVIALQRMGFGTGNYPAYSAPQQQQGIRPVIEPVVSIPLNSGNGRERRESRRERKAAEKESRLQSQSESESEDESEKTSKLVVGNTNDKGPGYFEARRLKKEGQSSISKDKEAADSSEISTDSLETAIPDSSNVLPANPSADSTLQAENLWLKEQINDIQKNQDSLLLILTNLLTKVAQPVAQPEPVIVEKEVVKEVKQEVDPTQIIDGILSQPSTKVFFAVGKSAVGNQYKSSLDQLANQLKTYPELKIELKGFADPTGNAAANMKLSENRAQSVKTYLQQVHSISSDRITVLPVGQEDNTSDLSYSRRVEVKLVR